MSGSGNIGQYRIVRKIGAGGMGCVYLGEHILLGRRAAIKTLLPSLSAHREIVDRFFNEARATSAINDHGVVQIFDFGYHVDGTAYIVMELLEGESLQARLDRLGKLPPSEALRVTRQVAGSLAAAHTRGIVHRDLKPENIFLIADPEAQSGERTKILDFGICKLGESDASLTQSGTTMGTPVYMSPEQCRGAGGVDHRSDIYALGCVLFHILVGKPPFEGEGAGEFIVAHLQEPAPAPSSILEGLPDIIDGLVARCLAKDPEDRFQSMQELQVAIEQVLARISATGLELRPSTPVLPLAAGYRSSYDVNLGTPVPTQNLRAPTPRGNHARGSNHPAASSKVAMTSGSAWFVDPERAPAPASDDDLDDMVASVRPRWGRRLVLAFGRVGAIAALVVTRYSIDSDASAESAYAMDNGPDAGVDDGPDAAPIDAPEIDAPPPADAADVLDAPIVAEPLPIEPLPTEPEPPVVLPPSEDERPKETVKEPEVKKASPAKKVVKKKKPARKAERRPSPPVVEETFTPPTRPAVTAPSPEPKSEPEDLYDTR